MDASLLLPYVRLPNNWLANQVLFLLHVCNRQSLPMLEFLNFLTYYILKFMSPFYVFLNFFDIFGKIITKFITEAKDFCVFFGGQYKLNKQDKK